MELFPERRLSAVSFKSNISRRTFLTAASGLAAAKFALPAGSASEICTRHGQVASARLEQHILAFSD
jgi:hypothetical protein